MKDKVFYLWLKIERVDYFFMDNVLKFYGVILRVCYYYVLWKNFEVYYSMDVFDEVFCVVFCF